MLMAAKCSFLVVLYPLVVVLSGSYALPKCCVSFDSIFYYRSHVFSLWGAPCSCLCVPTLTCPSVADETRWSTLPPFSCTPALVVQLVAVATEGSEGSTTTATATVAAPAIGATLRGC